MAIKMRLARGGSKKRPYYRIVVADERAPRDGRYIEKVGTYNPMLAKDNAERVIFADERVKYWLGEGAQPTDRVKRFLAAANFVDAREVPAQTKQHLQSERTKMKIDEREEKRKTAMDAAEEAKAAAEAPAPAPAEEAPAEEVVTETTETPAEEKSEA